MAKKSPVDEQVEKAEKAVITPYVKAQKEIRKMIQDYFNQFAEADAKKQEQVEKGEISKTEYKDWRRRTMCEGKKYEAFRDKLAKKYLELNREAMKTVNKEELAAYQAGANYSFGQMEKKLNGEE